jgi:hypothetical protein
VGLFLSEGMWLSKGMSTGQLWLFPPPQPLVTRLGVEFFRSLPTQPGVYLMCGPQEGVLYVGKAKNLRKRLASYRVANPERLPRRIVRLLHLVSRIEIDLCPTEEAAREREELLICVLTPKFNRAGKPWVNPQTSRGWAGGRPGRRAMGG